MRKICEPTSNSKPHVTVRGPISKIDNNTSDWKDYGISYLDLLGPGCFFSKVGVQPTQNTVYIKCFSEEIYDIHYKPDYITSRPHITLYDGNSRNLAEKLFNKIKLFKWSIRINLPASCDKDVDGYKYSHLSEIVLKQKSNKRKVKEILINRNLQSTYRNIFDNELNASDLINFTDDERVNLIEKIYYYLQSQFINNEKERIYDDNEISVESIDINSLYKEEMLLELHVGNIYKSEKKQLNLFESFQLKTKNSKPQKERNRLGQFPTPPELAIEIAQYVKLILLNQTNNIDFGDPSIGTGTFFYALEKVFEQNSISSAYGIEIDNDISLLTEDLWKKNGLNVVNGDFFDQLNLPKRNLILCNPPYIRHQYLSVQKKKQLKNRVFKELGINISGLASLYAYFLLLSHSWMQPNAIAAWLIPSEFLEVNYGECLRNYLTNFVNTILIHRYDPNKIKFEGVMVTSSVVIFKNEQPPKDRIIKLSFGGSLFSPERTELLAGSNFEKRIKWNRNIFHDNGSNANLPLVKDYFDIKRGIATGANNFFIITKNKAKLLGIPDIFLKPILPSPRKLKSTIIFSDEYGYPCIDEQLSLIDCNIPESFLKEKYPEMWEYLNKAKELNLMSRYLIKKRNLWYKQEQRPTPIFLCTYFGKEKENSAPLRFIWNKSNAIATNVYLLLYPKGKLQNLLEKNPSLQKNVYQYLTCISKNTMENGGRVYGGGLYKLEPSELGLLPLDGIESLFQ